MTGKSKVHFFLWAGAILAVFVCGFIYFPIEKRDIGFWQIVYYTIRLFFFEHDLSSFPSSPPLIAIYFIAPLITLSAVWSTLSYFFHLYPAVKIRFWSDHAIVCGVGRTGKIFIEALRAKGKRVVGIDLDCSREFNEWRERLRLPIVHGDFTRGATLVKAGADRAGVFVFTSGNDLINLEGAIAAYESLRSDTGPKRIIWAQISNEQLANTARLAVRTQGTVAIRFFDTYRISARKVMKKHFDRNHRKEITEINIIGFGKFGRDLFDIIIHDLSSPEKITIRIIDKVDREKEAFAIAREMNISDHVEFEQAAIQDYHPENKPGTAFFICTDDDLGNLATAMTLARHGNIKHIYVRMGHWPLTAVAENIGQDRGVYFINLNELVTKGIKDLPGIFSPATAKDLKRTKL